jgi:hypothetical protein
MALIPVQNVVGHWNRSHPDVPVRTATIDKTLDVLVPRTAPTCCACVAHTLLVDEATSLLDPTAARPRDGDGAACGDTTHRRVLSGVFDSRSTQ